MESCVFARTEIKWGGYTYFIGLDRRRMMFRHLICSFDDVSTGLMARVGVNLLFVDEGQRCNGCTIIGNVDMKHPDSSVELAAGHSNPYHQCCELVKRESDSEDEDTFLKTREAKLRRMYKFTLALFTRVMWFIDSRELTAQFIHDIAHSTQLYWHAMEFSEVGLLEDRTSLAEVMCLAKGVKILT
ncbi:hypothetical protein HU200_031693 [Digitaria exilis]|uniref:Uncharacterized protein n=1 Tax=Digitaria exilis TaxID=1010633 RepID=A0A835BMF8_9POAL|nr:hypothetical protein HU200_031693 [Digitaria exilis]